jgi:hypothetical protein
MMVARTASDLAAAIGGPTENKGSYWLICCPAHNDHKPSCSLRDGEKRVLLKCFSGCDRDLIVGALKQRGIYIGNRDERDDNDNIPAHQFEARVTRAKPETFKILQPPIGKGHLRPDQIEHPKHGNPNSVWHYRDASGAALFLTCRFDWTDETGPRKEVIPYSYGEQPDGKRRWRWVGPPAPRPLYGLHRLPPDSPFTLAVISEGEKCADAATTLFGPRGAGLTSLSGAGSVGHADWSPLQGRRVLILPDWDAPGWRYAHDVQAQALRAGATRVEFGLLPSGPPDDPLRPCEKGRDIHDLLTEGWTASLLRQAVRDGLMGIVTKLPQADWDWNAPALPTAPEIMRKILASDLPGAI